MRFGLDTKGGDSYSVHNNRRGCKFQAAGSGKADSITAWIYSSNGGNVKYALYDNGLNLLGQTEKVNLGPGFDAWKKLNFTGAKPDIVSGQNYYLVAWMDNIATCYIYYNTGGGAAQFRGEDGVGNVNGYPNPWVPGWDQTWIMSIYCDFSPERKPKHSGSAGGILIV